MEQSPDLLPMLMLGARAFGVPTARRRPVDGDETLQCDDGASSHSKGFSVRLQIFGDAV